MSGVRDEDYLMRQIRAAAQIVAHITGLRRGGQAAEAAGALEDAYGELLGPQAGIVRQFDAATAASLLGEPERILAVALLCREEAVQTADPARRAYLWQRARALGQEAVARAPGEAEFAAFVAEMAGEAPGPEV